MSTALSWIYDGDASPVASLAVEEQAAADDDFDSYSDELLDHRADLIAQTEAGLGAASAERIAWSQMMEDGFISRRARKVWVAQKNPCPVCEELDGQTVPMDELFESEDGDTFDGPPDPHPNCSCTLALVES